MPLPNIEPFSGMAKPRKGDGEMEFDKALRESTKREARYKVDGYRPNIIRAFVLQLQNQHDISKMFDADINLWKQGILFLIWKLQINVSDPTVRAWLGPDLLLVERDRKLRNNPEVSQ